MNDQTLTQDQYREAVAASKDMWCSEKPGEYGKGIIKDCELIGRLGEVAVAPLLNTKIGRRRFRQERIPRGRASLLPGRTASQTRRPPR